MASREGFRKLLRRYNYQGDYAALNAQAGVMWFSLTPAQHEELLKEDYRARIYAAGVEAGAITGRGGLLVILEHVADYLDLWAVEPGFVLAPGSLEELADEVLGAIRTVRSGEQP